MHGILKVEDDGTLVSVLEEASNASLGLQVGMGLVFANDVSIEPYGVVSKGCKCWVSYVDESSGQVELHAEGCEPALHWWHNIIVLMPYYTEELTRALVVSRSVVPVVPERNTRVPLVISERRALGLMLLAFLVGWLMEQPTEQLVQDVAGCLHITQSLSG